MKVLELSSAPRILAPFVDGGASHHVSVDVMSPSWAGFVTAMKLASRIRKDRCEVVVCHDINEAQAAISARKLVADQGLAFKIVLAPAPDYMPYHIPATVAAGVDMWMLATDAQQQHICSLDAVNIKASRVIAPTTDIARVSRVPHPALTLLWVGDLKDTDRLAAMVKGVSAVDTPLEVRICGTGHPRYVMPVVKKSRLDSRHNYVWLGDDYNIADELARADFGVAALPYPTSADIAMLGNGTIVLDLDDVDDFANTLSMLAQDADARTQAGQAAVTKYENAHSPITYVAHVQDLLFAVR